ncbi:MAG: SIS domain-containing protein [Holosporales bacterium]|jgi:arabinose-5-phosphate isomerase
MTKTSVKPMLKPVSSIKNHQAVGQRVLRIEAEGILKLCYALDEAFAEATELFAGVQGRVVLTGMGKSGHIAHKIAATLASLGTPSFFLHPAEAAHGDLGMLTDGDAVLALSDSGESPELASVLNYAARRQIPVVGITRAAKSTLGQASQVVLLLPVAEPACPLRLAPTTTTTMMLALGDALAVALLERRGFTADDYREFHPGGQLGQRLRRVAEVMHKDADMPVVTPETSVQDALLEMTAKRLGCTGVVDTNGGLLGIITDGDLRRHMDRDLRTLSAADIMSRTPKTITASAFLQYALATMEDASITVLFVVDEGNKPLGVVHIHDLLRAGVA